MKPLISVRHRFVLVAVTLLGLCLVGCDSAGTSEGASAGKVNPRFKKIQDKAAEKKLK